MFDHVTIRVSDRSASEAFYETVLAELGIEKGHSGEQFAEWNDFSLGAAGSGEGPTRRLHLAFVSPSREHVDRFWQAGVDAGHRSDGEPGPRPQYRADYYGGFLLDPDGNSAEAVHHGALPRGGGIDHLWIRVADVAKSRRFYEAVAPYGGYTVKNALPDHVQLGWSRGSFSLVAGDPTEGLHLAFPATEDEVVLDFHRALTGAGYADNGPPAERPVYHAGYYGAFVLDPDGNNVEVVNHNR